jgi:hypothetical protein
MKIIIPNKITESRLAQIRSEMETLGAPVIQCFGIGEGKYLASEGSHRLTAAKELGLIPVLDVLDVLDKDDPETEVFFIDAKRRELKGLVIEFQED